MAQKLSLALLQRQLLIISDEIEKLQEERREYMHKVRQIDRRISVLRGEDEPVSHGEESSDKPPVVSAHGTKQSVLVKQIVSEFKNKPFTMKEVVSEFKNRGGISNSQNLNSVLYQLVRKIPTIQRTENLGVYVNKR